MCCWQGVTEELSSLTVSMYDGLKDKDRKETQWWEMHVTAEMRRTMGIIHHTLRFPSTVAMLQLLRAANTEPEALKACAEQQ